MEHLLSRTLREAAQGEEMEVQGTCGQGVGDHSMHYTNGQGMWAEPSGAILDTYIKL